jgi:hypothetical protein
MQHIINLLAVLPVCAIVVRLGAVVLLLAAVFTVNICFVF